MSGNPGSDRVKRLYPDGIVAKGKMIPDIGGGIRGPAYFDVVAQLPEHQDIDIQLRVALVDGRYEVTRMTLACDGGEVLTTEYLRLIPLRTIVRTTVGRALEKLNIQEAFGIKDGKLSSQMKLAHVAFTYRLARLLGEAPTKAVMAAEGVSRSTASRMVAAAREAGLLRPEEIGQAGGARSRLEG